MAADATFNQGDKVIYKCKTGSEILTRVCTSEGQWTQGGYVCGGKAKVKNFMNMFPKNINPAKIYSFVCVNNLR